MLKTRLINGLSVAAVLLATLFLVPSWLYMLILLTLVFWGMLEFYTLLDAAKISSFKVVGVAGGLLFNIAVWVECQYQLQCGTELLALFVIVCALFLRQLFGAEGPQAFNNLAGTLLGIMYVAFMLSFVTRIMITNGIYSGQWLLFYLLAVIKISDSGAYFVGTYLGRHKLAPRVSPKKTWEGLAGGLLAGLAASWTIFLIRGGDFLVATMNWTDAVALGILLPCVGVLGDLAESLLKRAANRKDSSSALKGLGGLLDMADSILPAVPLLYFWTIFAIN